MNDSSNSLNKASVSRRTFVKSASSAAILGVFGVSVMDSRAEVLPKLDSSEPTAVALKYVHDANTVSESLRPQKDRFCNNCSLYAGGKDDQWAGCPLFPGKSVAGKGWCNAWVPGQQ